MPALLTVTHGAQTYFLKYELPLLMRPGYRLYIHMSCHPPEDEELAGALSPAASVSEPAMARLPEGSADWNILVATAMDGLAREAASDGHGEAVVVSPGCTYGAATDPVRLVSELMPGPAAPRVVCANVARGALYADPSTLRTITLFDRDVFGARLRMGQPVPVRSAFGGLAVITLPASFSSLGEPPFWSVCEGRDVVVLPQLRGTQRGGA